MRLKKITCVIVAIMFLSGLFIQNECFALGKAKTKTQEQPVYTPESINPSYPKRCNEDYLKLIRREYRRVTKDENIAVALDMMKDTNADFSRTAILGYNLTKRPVKVMFKDLSKIDEKYASFDALGWKKSSKLYIYINECHEDAPPAALAALLSHEALHQDEYNSLAEETYAWTMEAAVWCEMCELYPKETKISHPLVTREETLKKLFIKGRYSDRYIKKSVHSNSGYKDLPQTSPGFEKL